MERHWCAKESPKTLPIDTLWLLKRNYHRTFTSKAVAGVFALLLTGRYTVTSVSVEREHMDGAQLFVIEKFAVENIS